jgi:hypothetical protein
MQTRIAFWLGAAALVGGACATWSLTRGQDRPAVAATDTPRSDLARSPADSSRLTPLQRQMLLSAQRGGDWLFRANRADGRFVYGFLPALNSKLEGDHYLRQAGAAFALARVARFLSEDRHGNPELGSRYAVRAKQAILALLMDTASDPKDPQVRHTTLPSVLVNRLGAAGLLVLAIHELPDPASDLLDQAEQLCFYIARQQQADGALCFTDVPGDARAAAADPEGINFYPGEALYGLIRSQKRRPAEYKLKVVRAALPYYRKWWQAHPNMAFVPWQTAAWAEAYLQTQETAFADAVYEMNDWLCGLQYALLDPRQPLWVGGFMSWQDGKPSPTPPGVSSAVYAESLAEACRVARQAGDLQRFPRYREALERCLQFLATLQYTEANTQHFADWYRPALLGAFYASHQDGHLRIDYTQHAVCALVQYLGYVAERQ